VFRLQKEFTVLDKIMFIFYLLCYAIDCFFFHFAVHFLFFFRFYFSPTEKKSYISYIFTNKCYNKMVFSCFVFASSFTLLFNYINLSVPFIRVNRKKKYFSPLFSFSLYFFISDYKELIHIMLCKFLLFFLILFRVQHRSR